MAGVSKEQGLTTGDVCYQGLQVEKATREVISAVAISSQ